MITHTQLDDLGKLDLPPEALAEAGFSRDTPLECVAREGEIILRRGEALPNFSSFREAVRHMQEASVGYSYTTEEVMCMTRGED